MAGSSFPTPAPLSVAMAVSPQCSHCLGFELCLLSRNCASTDMLSVTALPCFSCFLNILLLSLRNFLSGREQSLVDQKDHCVWVFHTSVFAKMSFIPSLVIS